MQNQFVSARLQLHQAHGMGLHDGDFLHLLR